MLNLRRAMWKYALICIYKDHSSNYDNFMLIWIYWVFQFLYQKIPVCFGYLKEPPIRDSSFEYPKHIQNYEIMKIIIIYSPFLITLIITSKPKLKVRSSDFSRSQDLTSVIPKLHSSNMWQKASAASPEVFNKPVAPCW